MAASSLVDAFIASQQSLQWYGKAREALRDVLLALPDPDFLCVIHNLIIVALHEGVFGQAMHFPNPEDKFKVVQLTLFRDTPISVLHFVIAHELGHVMQGRNWRKGDGKEFEDEASGYAKKWGFPATPEIDEYIAARWKDPEGH